MVEASRNPRYTQRSRPRCPRRKLTREATKEVENKIDQYYWQNQRLWEVKRDTYIEVVKSLGKVRATVSDLVGATASKSLDWEKKEDRDKADKSFIDAGKAFWESFEAFVISKTLTMLVAPEPLVNRFKETNNAIAQIRTQSLLSASSPEDMHTLLERGQHLALMIENLVGFVYEDLAEHQGRDVGKTAPEPAT